MIILFSTACTTSSTHNRGSLSSAMDKSRDDYEDERDVPDEEIPDYDNEDQNDEDDYYDDSNDYSPAGNTGPSSLQLLLRGGKSPVGGPYFSDSLNGEILVGDASDHWGVYLTAGFNVLKLNPDHNVSDSIEDKPLALNAAVEGRYYLIKDMKFFSPYILGRIGGFIFFWEFKNPLVSGSDTIYNDSLGGFLLGGGAGVDLYRGDIFSISASVIPEWYVFGEQTSQGFTNDYFGSQGFVRWGVESGIRF